MTNATEHENNTRRAASSATSYSIRMDGALREAIDQAATIRNTTMGQFVREAAAFRAQDIMNAHAPRDRAALHELATKVWTGLLNPRVRLIGDFRGREVAAELDHDGTQSTFDENTEHTTADITTAAFARAFEDGELQKLCQQHGGESWDCAEEVRLKGVEFLPMKHEVKKELTLALQKACSEFAHILIQELDAFGSEPNTFTPTFDAAKLLNPNEEERH